MQLLSKYLYLIGFLSYIGSVNAQFALHHFNSEHGLDNELVKCSARDSLGFIWAATDDGLYRFNGASFDVYQEEFTSRYIKWVECLPSGELYAVTDLGLYQIDYTPTTAEINLVIPGSTEMKKDHLCYPKSISPGNDGSIWVSDDFGIGRFYKDEWDYYEFGKMNTSECFLRAGCMVELAGDVFVFAQKGSAYKLSPEKNHFEEINTLKGIGQVNHAMDHDGKIYFGTSSGLYSWNGQDTSDVSLLADMESSHFAWFEENLFFGSWAQGILQKSTQKDSLVTTLFDAKVVGSVNHINSFGDEMWVSSDEGLFFLEPQSFQQVSTLNSFSFIADLSASENESVLISQGNNLIRVAPDKLPEQIHHHNNKVLCSFEINQNTFFTDDRGKVYKKTDYGARMIQNFSRSGNGIHEVEIDNSGRVWCLQEGNPEIICMLSEFSYFMLGEDDGLTADPTVLRTSPDGTVYCGAYGDESYLFKYSEDTERFINVSEPLNFDHNLPLKVNDLSFRNDSVWLASNFGLLTLHDQNLDRFSLGRLTDEEIKSISATEKALWVGASVGLIRIDERSQLIFDAKQGLPTKTQQYRGLLTHDNALWVATNNGLAYMPIDLIPEKSSAPIIVSLNRSGENIELVSKVEIDTQDMLKIDFRAPEYPERHVEYRWRIPTLSEEWSNPELGNGIIVNHLSEGNYTLEVQALKKGNHLWSDTTILPIRTNVVWYFSTWFIVFATVLLTTLGLLVIFLQRYRYKKREIRLSNLVQERTSELELAKDVAERSALAKSQFLSTMSHEIRTPMNAVIGISHLMLESSLDDDQTEKMESLKFSATNLLGILNDILDYNKIESGKLELENRTIGIRQFMRNVHMSIGVQAKQKEIGLDWEVAEDVPDLVEMDSTRMSQVIMNLLSNAIKFTSKGGVVTKVKKVAENENLTLLSIEVQDSGIGIPKDKQALVFESFTQANSSTTRMYGGTGLGLAIVKRTLEIMGGDIRIESEEGKGTSFIFEVWLETRQGCVIETPLEKENSSDIKGLKILLAEDNDMNIMVATSFLKLWDVEFKVAKNGLEAVAMWEKEDFDVILMDLQMPEMDGIDATKCIREKEKGLNKHIPIVALTASALTQSKDKVIDAGMDTFITKPFKPEELIEVLGRLGHA
ncbi:MAG: ATP-binding protein [Flavobacteriales bacterium]|nr:ATP-binding protein [Flavobacteriales bacterium]